MKIAEIGDYERSIHFTISISKLTGRSCQYGHLEVRAQDGPTMTIISEVTHLSKTESHTTSYYLFIHSKFDIFQSSGHNFC